MENVWTCPSRKLASGAPVFAVPGRSLPSWLKVNDPVGDGGWITFSRSHRQSKPGLDRVPSLHPRQRVGDLRHAGVEVRRGVHRRSEAADSR